MIHTTKPRHRAADALSSLFNWLLRLETQIVARSLNLPAPLINDIGAIVFARVQAAEHIVAQAVYPARFKRALHRWLLKSLP